MSYFNSNSKNPHIKNKKNHFQRQMSSEEDLFSDNPYNDDSVYSDGNQNPQQPPPGWLNQYLAYDKMRLLNDVDPLTLNEIRTIMGDQEFIDHWMLSQDEYNYVVDGQSTVGDMNELENIDEVTDDGNTKFSGEEEYINTDGDDMEDNYNPEEEYKSPVILTKAEYIPTTQLTQQNPNSQIQTVKPKKEKQIPNVPIQINPQNTTVNQTNQVTAGFTGVNVPLRKIPAPQPQAQTQVQHRIPAPQPQAQVDEDEEEEEDQSEAESNTKVTTIKPAYSVYHPVGGQSYLIGPDGKVEHNKLKGSQYVQQMIPGSIPLGVAGGVQANQTKTIQQPLRQQIEAPIVNNIPVESQSLEDEEEEIEMITLPNGLKAKRIKRGRLDSKTLQLEQLQLEQQQQQLRPMTGRSQGVDSLSQQQQIEEPQQELGPKQVYINDAGQKVYINSRGEHMIIDNPQPVINTPGLNTRRNTHISHQSHHLQYQRDMRGSLYPNQQQVQQPQVQQQHQLKRSNYFPQQQQQLNRSGYFPQHQQPQTQNNRLQNVLVNQRQQNQLLINATNNIQQPQQQNLQYVNLRNQQQQQLILNNQNHVLQNGNLNIINNQQQQQQIFRSPQSNIRGGNIGLRQRALSPGVNNNLNLRNVNMNMNNLNTQQNQVKLMMTPGSALVNNRGQNVGIIGNLNMNTGGLRKSGHLNLAQQPNQLIVNPGNLGINQRGGGGVFLNNGLVVGNQGGQQITFI